MQRVYLITGADSDVGMALIKSVAQAGDTIIAQGYSSVDALEAVCKGLNIEHHIFKVDLTDVSQTENFINKVKSLQIPVSHYIHLPALPMLYTKLPKLNDELLLMDFNVQLNTAIAVSKAVVPSMVKNQFGRILFMLSSSIMGVPPKNVAAYTIVKSSLEALMKSLAIDYAAKGITANCVAPSMMETKFLQNTPSLVVQASASSNPMGRNAQVDDVVPAMKFLLSDEAAFITGVTLPITGGSAMH